MIIKYSKYYMFIIPSLVDSITKGILTTFETIGANLLMQAIMESLCCFNCSSCHSASSRVACCNGPLVSLCFSFAKLANKSK